MTVAPLPGRVSDLFWRRPVVLLLLLAPPLLWLGVIHVGSLVALLLQGFFAIDEFSGLIPYEFNLKTFGELFRPSNDDILLRTFFMAAAVTLAAAIVAFPMAFYAARYARASAQSPTWSRWSWCRSPSCRSSAPIT